MKDMKTIVTTNALDTLLNTLDTYKALQPFSSIEELNANTTEIRAQYADQMTPSTYAVLDVLHRYASKYYGVSYLSKSKIATMLGISRRTVIRACKTLEDFGVIVQHELKRHNGDRRQSSNAIVFVPITPEVTPECHTVDAPAYAPKDLKDTYVTCACGNINDEGVVKKSEVTKQEQKDEVPKPKASLDAKEILNTDRLPEDWFNAASPYATDANDLYRINGSLFKAKHGMTLRIEEHVDTFSEVLRSSWFKLKNGRINPSKWYGYLYTAFKKTAMQIENADAHTVWYAELTEMYEPR